MNNIIKIEEDKNERLDKILVSYLKLSRNQIQNYIKDACILVNGEKVKASYEPVSNDIITINIVEEKIKLEAEEIPLDVIYEDKYILVINKPQDFLVHPTNEEKTNTLVNALLYYTEDLGRKENSIRPGIVHRLDKDTSGLLVVAKTDESYDRLVESFSKGKVFREYLSIVHGQINDSAYIEEPIGRNPKNRTQMWINYKNGKYAKSHYELIENFQGYSFIKVRLYTGRMHQIRVHMAYINHPVVGDLIYGRPNDFNINKQMLHAYKIGFEHPVKGGYIEFESPIPKRFEEFIKQVKK